ncbi:serine/threonine-protein kinase mph1 [Colletes gigas]|uniref:serine/threonine-protein kinase mph1 n=1 Tax=Colletes gigas TaxID=935657 RepID=UPI001C9A35D3|nr:serine/threonine-protein kinase mph1 [Colletes gigas]
MKLGDNMTMEAYNIWGDVPPRKCRPPKIGDIPKHSAVDEESPGSISKSLTVPPTDSIDSTLDVSLDSSRNIVFPLDSSSSSKHFSSIQNLEPRNVTTSTETRFQYHRGTPPLTLSLGSEVQDFWSVRQEPTLSRRGDFERKSPCIRSSEGFVDSDSKVTINLPLEESTLKAKDSEDSFRIPSSPEEVSDSEIVEVRKDSALFLEEAEGLPTLREILRSRGPRIVRPRRESSGYASNLGTFDEDRRSSSSTDVLQDLSSFLKDRRRSSTGLKRLNSRVILGRAEESLTEEVVDIETNRMPTTEMHRKVSSTGLDMPNIDEVKELLRDEVASRQMSMDNLCDLVQHTSVEELSATRLRDPSTVIIDTSFPSESLDRLSTSPTSRNALNRIVRERTVRNVSNVLEELDQASDRSSLKISIERSESTVDEIRIVEESVDRLSMESCKEEETSEPADDAQLRVLPRSIKVYQLLSTQSEDRTDGELHLSDRRISLQISKQDDLVQTVISPAESNDDLSVHDGGSTLTLNSSVCSDMGTRNLAFVDDVRKVQTPSDVGSSPRFLGDASNVNVRPIYPYCPYSPYGSPQGSPRNRRRPLRESRRVSIDNRQGALQLNQYKLLDNIGQGSFGIVKLVYNEEDETHYAMKILSKRKLMKKAGIFGRMAPGRKGAANPLAKVYREIALLKKLDHPNVVKLVEVLDDPDEDNLYLVFELVQKGEILQIPTDRPLDEETARKNFRDVVMGVEYLHYQRIVHRDIKPSNLLVDSDGRIKIADLGVSAELRASGELLSGPAGTPAFAAPETTTPGAHYSGTLCDVWSMGVTLYSLVTGKVPWDGAGSIIGVQAAIRTEPIKFPEKPALSDDLCDLISKMVAKNPVDRISLPDIKTHVWLTNHGAEPLPSEVDNCRLPVTVTDEEVERVVTRIPKLDTLILIKTMLKQHSFQNPFLPKKSGKTVCADAVVDGMKLSPPGKVEETMVPRKTARNAKTERFQRTGRSNSAPDSYDWQANGRQMSIDNPLPPVTEASTQETEPEKR